MNKLFTVLGHTYFTRVKSKPFIISTITILLLLTLAANIQAIIDIFASDDGDQIIVIDETEQYVTLLEQQLTSIDENIELISYEADVETGKEEVHDGTYDGLLTLTNDTQDFPQATYYENNAAESWNQSILEQQLQQMK